MGSYSHKDTLLTFTPLPGAPTIHIAQPFRIFSCTKASFDPGGKASYGKGFAATPYAILVGSAEPKLEYDLSDGTEGGDAVAWLGGVGAGPFEVSHVFYRLGIGLTAFSFGECVLENGGGFDSDDGSGKVGKVSIKLLTATRNGKSIFV